jgi:hypothetical protein
VPVVGDVAGLASDAYRFATDPESRTLGNAAWASLGMLPFVPYMGAIRAYHGSPHTFDRFDMSKIGTGEGAQAYGHGLYFAESPAVAKGYKDALSRAPNTGNAGQDMAQWAMAAARGDKNLARAKIREGIEYYEKKGWPSAEYRAQYDDALNVIDRGGVPESGAMYTVDLDVEPDDLLDWDAPLSQQSEKVRGAVGPMAQDAARPTEYHRARGITPTPADEMTGEQLYRALARHDAAAAAQSLRNAGIPGIRYLDGGSRASGEGTRNFVLFDDTLAKILERNGQPVK